MSRLNLIPAALLAGAALAAPLPSFAQNLSVEIVADGLDHPWAVAKLPEGGFLLTERSGKLVHLSDGAETIITGVPEVVAQSQGGLLDLVLDDEFDTNRRLYFTYSQKGPKGASTALGVAIYPEGGTGLTDVAVLFDGMPESGTRHHYGSRIVLGPDDTLFMTTGDRGASSRAQDRTDPAGSVLRLNQDGSIPADNPFPDNPIWSMGHRNPQGATWDPVTGSVWTVEHGARGGDELNQPQAGRNYGWPVISYGTNYNGTKIGIGSQADGFEQPVRHWDPSIAPSGLEVYEGNLFPDWEGDFLVGALKNQMLVRLHREGDEITSETHYLKGEYGRIRDVRVFDDGAIYLLTDSADGKLLRVTPE